ncbi:MAG: hypothetical protein GX754_11500, partial [Clostridiaceae bacterium]|nr:hypothetical protein [Clostridiaceae bacterium]
MKKTKAHVISHTHWDREWYMPFEEMRLKLVDLIDTLMEILENSEEYRAFLMDGQAIILEDYLEIKPQNGEHLKKLISSGRIQVGPWYILPDELLISGESHIRNYIEGKKVCSRLGGGLEIGYLPDSFGHPAQMPQILKGLGMDTIVFWRGASHDIDKTEFVWRAMDGSEILGIHMPFGYGNSAYLSRDMSVTLPRVKRLTGELSRLSNTGVVLLMNGSDHVFPQRDLPGIIKGLKKEMLETGIDIHHSTLTEFVDAVKSGLGNSYEKLKIIEGELRYTHRSLLLGGTLSTRMYLKQLSHVVEKNIERYVEPFCVFDVINGGKYPKDAIVYGWKNILKNHPHDNICGCSVDSVHDDMVARYERIIQLENDLMNRAMKSMAGKITSRFEFDACITVFNPVQETRSEYIEVEADLDRMLVLAVDYAKSTLEDTEDSIEHPPLPEGVEVYDSTGNSLEAVLLSAWKDYEMVKSDHTLPEIYKVNRCRIGLYAKELPALGYTTFYIRKSSKNIPGQGIGTGEAITRDEIIIENAIIENVIIENEYYIVVPEPSGTFRVTDKLAGHVYTGCNNFVDGGDAGDEYTYSYPEKDSFFGLDRSSIKVSTLKAGDLVQQVTVEGILNLPESLTGDRKERASFFVPCPVKATVTLKKGEKLVRFKTEIINRAKDHRLQVFFPSGVLSDKSHAESQFCVVSRDIEPDMTVDWVEIPPTAHPHKGFVDVNDGTRGAAVITRGLSEFEVRNMDGQSWIAITLLRCVGWLSRNDLLTREGNGGWPLETPGAQCLGEFCFEYAFMPHGRTWEDAEIYKISDSFLHPVKYVQCHDFSREKPDRMSFIGHVTGSCRVSAVKGAENGDGYIARFYNISTRPVNAAIVLGFDISSAEETTLDERKIRDLEVNGREITLEMRKG